ncbi:synaptogyrin-3-like [Petromyzon marinus]|uniref:Synaptogyrin-3-like n=1 Tax=Petromyzon marinus TaxID=7757 RepID=A0AAJ7TUB8_PETMA|nr:synaptogyrin-3-like [Petromyzon marinus]
MEGAYGAYGAGPAGSNFDVVAFVKRPTTILSICSTVFAIVVFGCIVGEGHINHSQSSTLHCVYNDNEHACGLATATAILSAVSALAFLVLDVRFTDISSVQHRKAAVLGELGLSGLWAFLWFVCFCFLTNQWSKTAFASWMDIVGGSARAAIAFSFFSIPTWVGLTIFIFQKYRLGAHFGEEYTDPSPAAAQLPDSESYQAPPFPHDLGRSGTSQ